MLTEKKQQINDSCFLKIQYLLICFASFTGSFTQFLTKIYITIKNTSVVFRVCTYMDSSQKIVKIKCFRSHLVTWNIIKLGVLCIVPTDTIFYVVFTNR